MIEYAHGFRMNEEACDGCLACMRACPTCAIRVKHDKASVQADLCIDCGSCLKACTRGAIIATTQKLEEFAHFAFKVAIPSPVLFGQFPLEVPPEIITRGLLAAGFDAVWDYGVDLELGARAIADYAERWRGARPLVNMTCPVIVRLIQVSYPRMTEQLLQMEPPREIAGRELKRHYSRELGLPSEQIAAIYVSPCQARTISIVQPALECRRTTTVPLYPSPTMYANSPALSSTTSSASGMVLTITDLTCSPNFDALPLLANHSSPGVMSGMLRP